jgi:hypothetical protein
MFDIECVGNIHVHTSHSDGSAGVSEVAASAASVGLDFICINDHSYMTDALHIEEEAFYGKVLVLVGLEIGLRYHHYLAFNLETRNSDQNPPPQEMIDWVNRQGGFGFMAHPFEKGMPFVEKSTAYTWNDLSVTDHTGLCLWNFTSRWKERVKSFFHGLFFLYFKTQTLKGPSRETLNYWDQECLKRRFAAVGGSDAHGSVFKWGPFALKPFAYDYLLNSINIHVFVGKKLPRDLREAKAEVYGAMKEGRLFIAHDNLHPAKGFRFYFYSSDGSDLYMGEEGDFQPGEIVIELPSEGEIRLMKDGKLLQKWRGKEVVYQVTEKGVYRVEVCRHLFFFGWRPWIFSNPIYLR